MSWFVRRRADNKRDLVAVTGTSKHTTAESSVGHTPYAKLQRHLNGMRDSIYCIAISPDGSQLAAGSNQGEIRTWDVAQGIGDSGSGFILSEPNTFMAYGIAFSPINGRYLAASIGKTVHLWIAKTSQPIAELDHDSYVTSIGFSPDGSHIACGAKDIFVWNVDAEPRQQIHVLKGHTNFVRAVTYFPSGGRLVSASSDGTIRIWDPAHSHEETSIWKAHDGKKVWTCALSPDGKILASGGEDQKVVLWDVRTGEWITRPYLDHSKWVAHVSFSPDGNQVASASNSEEKGEVHIQTMLPQESNPGSIVKLDNCYKRLVFSPDGKYVATVDAVDNASIRILQLGNPLKAEAPKLLPTFNQTQTLSPVGTSSLSTPPITPTRIVLADQAKSLVIQNDCSPPPYE